MPRLNQQQAEERIFESLEVIEEGMRRLKRLKKAFGRLPVELREVIWNEVNWCEDEMTAIREAYLHSDLEAGKKALNAIFSKSSKKLDHEQQVTEVQ